MAQQKSRTAQLNGLQALSYLGVLPSSPTNFLIKQSDPTTNDYRNVYVGDLWLNNASFYQVPSIVPNIRNLWILVSVANNIATWVHFGSGTLETLTGNTGGPVSPDNNDNINVVGDGTTITVAGNPGTNTLTISAVGTGVVSTLTGNTGGAVSPLAGNINVVGDGVTVNVAGNPGTHTLTISAIGGGGTVTTLHTDDGNNVTPTAGVINLHGTHGLNTTGTVGPNTATVAINNAITLGDLANLGAGVAALNAQTGDITITANAGVGNLNLPVTTATGNAGVVTQGGTGGANRFIHSYGVQNVFVGPTCGNFTLTGADNLGIGGTNMQNITSGDYNVGVGQDSLAFITSGSHNTGCGVSSLGDLTTSPLNTAIGFGTLPFLTTGSGQNTAVGFQSLFVLLTGNSNTCIGYESGINYATSESNNIIVGSAGGVVGESNITRIGFNIIQDSVQAKCFVDGIRGVTTDAADAIAVLISSTGQLGTVSSSRKVKDNINDMGRYSECLYRLRPVTFNYNNRSSESISVGLIAEEVYESVPQLVVHSKDGEIETVKYQDLVPMLLNEIQKLNRRIEVLERK